MYSGLTRQERGENEAEASEQGADGGDLPVTPRLADARLAGLETAFCASPRLPVATPTDPNAALIGECLLARHPTLEGRVLVRWLDGEGDAQECWVPVLRHLAVRERDRVLLLCVANEPLPVVVGVVDGFARRAEPKTEVGVALELKRDEVFRLQGQRGEPLIEIRHSDEGPVVRLLSLDTEVELPGKLRIKAAEIELRAERGGVHVEASDDVVIQGETVRLN